MPLINATLRDTVWSHCQEHVRAACSNTDRGGGASLLGADASLGPNKLAGAHLGDRGLGNYCDNLRIILS